MRTVQTILSTALFASCLLGIQILLMDKWLWNAAPAHAYGLVIFVLVDSLILAAIWKKAVLATVGAALASTLQLAAMLGDIAIGQPSNISASVFKEYLLANTAFTSLLATQGVILVLAAVKLAMPLAQRHRLTLSQLKKN